MSAETDDLYKLASYCELTHDTVNENSWCVHCTYTNMPKRTGRVEAMHNSEKVKPIVLVIVKVRLPEGIS